MFPSTSAGTTTDVVDLMTTTFQSPQIKAQTMPFL